MKRVVTSTLKVLFLAVFIILVSCREEFDSDFRVVEIINNAPEISSEIGEQEVAAGESIELDLAGFITDKEGDPVSYTVTSSDENIVTVSVSGSLVTINGVAIGSATISLTGTDGNEGNEVSTTFDVVVLASVGPQAVYSFNFDLPDGTADDGIVFPGTSETIIEGDGTSTMVIQSGVVEWSLEEYQGFTIVFDPPLDLTESPYLQFDYADAWIGDVYIIVSDDAGGDTGEIFLPDEADGGPVLNDPSWNTYRLDLSGTGVDVSSVSEVYFEKAGGPGDWRFDNFQLGPVLEPVYGFGFDLPNGTADDAIVFPDADVTIEGDGTSTMVIQNGVVEWSLEEYQGFTLVFDPPLDISENPLLEFDYANAWSGDVYIIVSDDAGADTGEIYLPDEADGGPILDDANWNTYSLDLSGRGIDLTAVSEVYFEKADGPGDWLFDNFILGPGN